MAAISIGDAVGEGFALIRRRPGAVLAWGALNTAWSLMVTVLAGPSLAQLMKRAQAMQHVGAADPAQVANLGPALRLEGVLMVVALASGIVSLILTCAVFRSVLRSETRDPTYLRLGSAELFLFAFGVGGYFALILGALGVAIPVGLLASILGLAHAPLLSGLVVYLGVIVGFALLIWVAARLSVAGPMIVEDGRFHLNDAWMLTKGHAASLLAIGLCLIVILILMLTISAALTVAIGGSQATGVMSLLSGGAAKPVNFVMPTLSVRMAARYLIQIPISGCFLAIWAAPWARVYLDLAHPDVATTFG